jgi:hypothetical protein
MKSIKLYTLILLLSTLFSCSEDIMDKINENPNNPVDMASRLIITDVMTASSFNVTGSEYAFYTSVYIELNTGISGQMYNAEIRLAEPTNASTYNGPWRSLYYNLYHLKLVIEKCVPGGSEAGNYQTLGIAEVLKAYNLAMLTDLMGDVPYSEALQPGVIYQPKLDKQQEIYTEVFRLLDDAILNLGKTSTFASLGTQDVIYGGNSARWIKAAQGLKARYTMRLSLKSPQYSKVIDYANASFANAADEFKFVYNGTSAISPFARFFQDRNYFGVSASLNNKLLARKDPRSASFFRPYPGSTVLNIAPNGNPQQVQQFYGVSAISTNTSPTYLMSYHELNFLKAEAYARMNQKDNAETALKTAIEAAFLKIGLTVAAANTYYTTNIKALFDADPLKEIMNQKYIASFEQEAVESYNDYRRLIAMGNNIITLANTRQFPQRLTYGDSDVTTNQNIATAYGDGNYVYTEKVWWAGGTR